MKLVKTSPFRFNKDKKIDFEGFRDGNFRIESRWLWSEVLIKELGCEKCGSEERITLHSKDIKKMIKALTIMDNLLKKKNSVRSPTKRWKL